MEGKKSVVVGLVLILSFFAGVYGVIDIASNSEGVIYSVAVDSKTLTALWAFTYEGDYVVQSTGILQLSPEIDTVLSGPYHTPTYLGVESNTSTFALVLNSNDPSEDNSSLVVTAEISSAPGVHITTTTTNILETGQVVAIDVSDNNAFYLKRTSSGDYIYQAHANGTATLLDDFPLPTAPNTTTPMYIINPHEPQTEALYISFTTSETTLYIVSQQCSREIASESTSGKIIATAADLSLNVIVYLYQDNTSGQLLLIAADIADCTSRRRDTSQTVIYSFGCVDYQFMGSSFLAINSRLDEVAVTFCSNSECTLQTISLTQNTSAQTLATITGLFTSVQADEVYGRWVWSYQSNNTFTLQSTYASTYAVNDSTVSSFTGQGQIIKVQVYSADSRSVYLTKNGDDVVIWQLIAALNEDLTNYVVLDAGSGIAPNGFSLDEVNGYIVYGVPGCNNFGFEIRATRIPGVTSTPDLTGNNYYKAAHSTDKNVGSVTVNLYFSGLLNGLNECYA